MEGATFLTVIVLLFSVVFIFKGFYVVQQSEVIVIERLGKYRTTLTSGINWIIPFIDATRQLIWQRAGRLGMVTKIDMREMVLDIDEQSVITRDNVKIVIDAIMYVQITDPVKATYEIANLPGATMQLAQTTLRSLIGEMELDQTLSSRDDINNKLKTVLDVATDKWGLKVSRVELKNISPPGEVQAAMEKQMQAERERRAVVLKAEGDKQARIARSEGERQEKINQAQGDKEALVLRADGEAQAIEKVAAAQSIAIDKVTGSLNGNHDLCIRYLTAVNYLEKFGEFTQGEGDKVFLPYEAVGTLGSLGAISELFKSGIAK